MPSSPSFSAKAWHERARTAILDRVADEAVARGLHQLGVADVHVRPAHAALAVTADTLARVQALCACQVSSDWALVQRDSCVRAPGAQELDHFLDVFVAQRSAAILRPGRHGGRVAPVLDRLAQLVVADRRLELGLRQARGLIRLVAFSLLAMTDRAHATVQLRAVSQLDYGRLGLLAPPE